MLGTCTLGTAYVIPTLLPMRWRQTVTDPWSIVISFLFIHIEAPAGQQESQPDIQTDLMHGVSCSTSHHMIIKYCYRGYCGAWRRVLVCIIISCYLLRWALKSYLQKSNSVDRHSIAERSKVWEEGKAWAACADAHKQLEATCVQNWSEIRYPSAWIWIEARGDRRGMPSLVLPLALEALEVNSQPNL